MTPTRSLLLATLLLAACLDDAPLSPSGDQVRLPLAVIATALPESVVEARVYWIDLAERAAGSPGGHPGDGSSDDRLRLDLHPLVVDLRPCLPGERQTSSVWCDVFVEVKLFEAGQLAVQTMEKPVRLAPGGTGRTPTIYLARGNTPPALLLVEAELQRGGHFVCHGAPPCPVRRLLRAHLPGGERMNQLLDLKLSARDPRGNVSGELGAAL